MVFNPFSADIWDLGIRIYKVSTYLLQLVKILDAESSERVTALNLSKLKK